MSYHGEIAHQTLKNQTASNVEIRCRLEKIDKTGRSQQSGDTNPVTTDLLKTISMGFIADGFIFSYLFIAFAIAGLFSPAVRS